MDNSSNLKFSSGIPALDTILTNLRAGDNVVYQIENIDDYIPFVHAFCRYNNAEDLDLVYFRFAQHPYLLPEDIKASVYKIYPGRGFDYFISEIIRYNPQIIKGSKAMGYHHTNSPDNNKIKKDIVSTIPFLVDGTKPFILNPACLAEKRITIKPPYPNKRWRNVAGNRIPPIGFPVLGNGKGIP